MSYEYKIVESYIYLSENELNLLGDDGWRMTGLIDRAEPVRYIFVREQVAPPTAMSRRQFSFTGATSPDTP
jgi:hypothetical protein